MHQRLPSTSGCPSMRSRAARTLTRPPRRASDGAPHGATALRWLLRYHIRAQAPAGLEGCADSAHFVGGGPRWYVANAPACSDVRQDIEGMGRLYRRLVVIMLDIWQRSRAA